MIDFSARRLFEAFLLLVAMVAGAPSLAQTNYPSRAVRIVAPFPPGQGTDVIARLIAQQLSTAMGQSFYVENKPGAGGVIGARFVKDAAPDGYTLLVAGGGPLAINASLYAKQPYDPVKDFQAIGMIAAVPNILVVRPDFPVIGVRELVAYIHQRPGQLAYASSGIGVPGHLITELLRADAKLQITHVPYQGAGAAITGLIGGETVMMIDTIGALLPQVKAGRLKALATAGANRALALPNVPTLKESGYGVAAQGWSAIVAPAGASPEITRRLYEETRKIMASAEMRQRLLDSGNEPMPMTQEETAAYIKSEVANWAKAVKLSGARAE
jgi:tripartite-type tricarboxylate transporter receptor subunit TctC